MAPSTPIKLRARDAEDLEMIAAWLQDALVPLLDVAYLEREKRFVMVANRFMWETIDRGRVPARADPEGDAHFEDEGPVPAFERVNCGVCFDRVRAVRFRGLDLANKDHILNLLTLQVEPGAITLLFSGDAAICLEVEAIACRLEDIGEPWPTHWQPTHDEPEQSRKNTAGRQG